MYFYQPTLEDNNPRGKPKHKSGFLQLDISIYIHRYPAKYVVASVFPIRACDGAMFGRLGAAAEFNIPARTLHSMRCADFCDVTMTRNMRKVAQAAP
jgi:hypothetical protein